ncbi:hypothetical protein QBK99_23135 [Corticibacterium sp. UT-5YL-CI-8]|nr:hypothetical protein [Tianweitania sp. UT-5YL-CI-8]
MNHPEAQREVFKICDDLGKRLGKAIFAQAFMEDFTEVKAEALVDEHILSLRNSLLESGAVARDVTIVEEKVYFALIAEAARLSRIVVVEGGTA